MRRFSTTTLLASFLTLVILVQFGYPLTYLGQGWFIGHQVLYALMFVSGSFAAGESRTQLRVNLASALVVFAASIWYITDPENAWANLAAYAAVLPFQLIIIYSLARFTRLQTRVTVNTVLAALSIYLLIGATFVPVYGLIETVQPGSFVGGASPGEGVVWQQLIYYSYVTLNTVGYGDVQPINAWARSLSTLEAVVGVLYLAVAIARLVSLYGRDAA